MKHKIVAHLIGSEVFSTSKAAVDLFSTQQFGEKVGQRVLYSFEETLFLFDSGKLELQDYRGRALSKSDIERKSSRLSKGFLKNYAVFKDLRKKGYVVKSGLKFGAQFRAYEKNKKSKNHAKWLVFPVIQNDRLTWQNFASHNRVAHSTKKSVLIAVVDDEQNITYFETNWIKP